MFNWKVKRDVVKRIGMENEKGWRIVKKKELKKEIRILGEIEEDKNERVMREENEEEEEVMKRKKCWERRSIEKWVKERKVGKGIRKIINGICLEVGRGEREDIEMVEKDEDRGFKLEVEKNIVEGKEEEVEIEKEEKEDERRKEMKGDKLIWNIKKVVKVIVVGKKIIKIGVCFGDILRIEGKRRKEVREDEEEEKREDIGRKEEGEGKGVLKKLLKWNMENIVEVIEGWN